MSLTYTKRLALDGSVFAGSVLASDGSIVLTGYVDLGGELTDVLDGMTGDKGPTEAYRAWLAAGGKIGDPVVAPVARSATSYDLVSVLSDDEVTALSKVKAKDQHLFGKRDGPWPEGNPKIARFAAALGTSPAAWYDRALGGGSSL